MSTNPKSFAELLVDHPNATPRNIDPELFKIGHDGIPKELLARLVEVPVDIDVSEGHPLNPFVAPQLIVDEPLDVVILPDFRQFCYDELSWLSSRSRGFHSAEPKSDLLSGLAYRYGIETSRAMVLPSGPVRYLTIMHELLHDVFAHLSPFVKRRIVHAATRAYHNWGDLGTLLYTADQGFSNDYIKNNVWKKVEARRAQGKNTDDLYGLGNFTRSYQERVVDEFLAHFFTDKTGMHRFHPEQMKPGFMRTLQRVGYNMHNPPKLYEDEKSPHDFKDSPRSFLERSRELVESFLGRRYPVADVLPFRLKGRN